MCKKVQSYVKDIFEWDYADIQDRSIGCSMILGIGLLCLILFVVEYFTPYPIKFGINVFTTFITGVFMSVVAVLMELICFGLAMYERHSWNKHIQKWSEENC